MPHHPNRPKPVYLSRALQTVPIGTLAEALHNVTLWFKFSMSVANANVKKRLKGAVTTLDDVPSFRDLTPGYPFVARELGDLPKLANVLHGAFRHHAQGIFPRVTDHWPELKAIHARYRTLEYASELAEDAFGAMHRNPQTSDAKKKRYDKAYTHPSVSEAVRSDIARFLRDLPNQTQLSEEERQKVGGALRRLGKLLHHYAYDSEKLYRLSPHRKKGEAPYINHPLKPIARAEKERKFLQTCFHQSESALMNALQCPSFPMRLPIETPDGVREQVVTVNNAMSMNYKFQQWPVLQIMWAVSEASYRLNLRPGKPVIEGITGTANQIVRTMEYGYTGLENALYEEGMTLHPEEFATIRKAFAQMIDRHAKPLRTLARHTTNSIVSGEVEQLLGWGGFEIKNGRMVADAGRRAFERAQRSGRQVS